MVPSSKKILLLGDGAVGKTSLVRRFVEQKFDDRYIATIGVNVKKKVLDDLDIKLLLWDIYGQKMNKNLYTSHYSGADGAIITYDLTRYKTFTNLDGWISDVFSVTGKIPFVVLGNKFDLVEGYESSRYEDIEIFLKKEHKEVLEFYREVYDDIPDLSKVSPEDLWIWVEDKKRELEIDFPYFLTSAKTGENVEEAFYALGNLLVESDIK
ncbi:MAG: Rab family GTPase [Candidatus Saliniplasma sp.]